MVRVMVGAASEDIRLQADFEMSDKL